MQGEISYDLVMEDDMRFAEGAFRIAGGEWQVFIFARQPVPAAEFPGDEIVVKPGRWSSGVTGLYVGVPETASLNKQVVERVLKESLGVDEWVEVRGPDSMGLR